MPPGGRMIGGPLLIVPGSIGPGAGSTGRSDFDGTSATPPLGIGFGVPSDGAWARMMSGSCTGRPRAAAGFPSRAAGVASWANNPPGVRPSTQPRPRSRRFIAPPSGQPRRRSLAPGGPSARSAAGPEASIPGPSFLRRGKSGRKSEVRESGQARELGGGASDVGRATATAGAQGGMVGSILPGARDPLDLGGWRVDPTVGPGTEARSASTGRKEPAMTRQRLGPLALAPGLLIPPLPTPSFPPHLP